ncbi:hypothetical protein [Aeromonas veronii]|uniref:hypothetical protein n=1 Tax=Aeromonas veronii TaxID=654 RepID=UPI0002808300|nr:hypothetical protein [Aeromonas veronii]EKB14485.1 hypothetical protein HMPREF1169_01763 [Aeromonas veronii AER397]
MAYLIRKISYSKWKPCQAKELADYDADAITACTRTTNNTLSVWRTNNPDLNAEENKELITAIASIQQTLDVMDLVVLKEDAFIESGFDVVETLGDSKIESMNVNHRDLSGVNYNKLGIVSQNIVEAVENKETYKRFSIAEVQGLFLGYYGDEIFDSPISDRVKEKIKQRLGNAIKK